MQVSAWPLAALFGGITVHPSTIGEDRVPLPDAASVEFGIPAVSWSGLGVLLVRGAGAIVLVRRRSRRRAAASAPAAEG